MRVEVLNHASAKISNGVTVFIDPYNISGGKADLILITHSHHDHCSIADIRKTVSDDTKIVIPPDCTSKLARLEKADIEIMLPGDKKKIAGVCVEAVPAYNIGKSFHPKENQWLGYIVEVDGQRIYHAGDTDLIQEMKDIRADIALLPVGGKYTMNAKEAAKAADIIKPKIAIPMHYGEIVGSKDDALEFKELCKCKVELCCFEQK